MKNLLFLSFVAITLLLVPAHLASAAWNPFATACSNGSGSGSAVCTDKGNSSDPINGPNGVLIKVINIIAFIGGVAAVIMVIISGFRFVTAGGNSGNVSGARNTLIYSLVGLAVIAVSRTLLLFFLGAI